MEDGKEAAHERTLYLNAMLGYNLQKGNLLRAKELLDQGAQINKPKSECGQTHLSSAVSEFEKETMEFLIKHRANPNIPNREGDMPIHWAALYGDPEMVRMLMKAGADPTTLDRFGCSAFTIGIRRRYSGVLESLLANNPNLNAPVHKDGHTPLTFAMRNTENWAVRILLAAGANANQPDPQTGLVPLVLARDNIETVTTLLLYGADPAAALTQMRERGLEESAAAGVVEQLEGWPRVSPLKALCLRAVEKHRMTAGVPPLLLMMPDPVRVLENERQKRGASNMGSSSLSSPATKKQK